MPIKRAYVYWLENQDLHHLRTVLRLDSWLALGVLVSFILLIFSQVPWLQGHTGLTFTTPFICFLPTFIFGLMINMTHERLSDDLLMPLCLLSNAGIYFFCCSLIALSHPKSAFLFGTMLLFAAGYFGQQMRATPRHPFDTLGLLFALLLAALLFRPQANYTALFLLGLLAIYLNLQMGIWQNLVQEQIKEKQELREAFLAELQSNQAHTIQNLQTTLNELWGAKHDMRNQLTSILLNADFLLTNGKNLSPEEQENIFQELYQAASNANQIAEKALQHSKDRHLPTRSIVDLRQTLQEACTRTAQRYPKVALSLHCQEAHQVPLSGGQGTALRLFENLLNNACEGNGRQKAQHIEIHVTQQEHAILLQCSDDGPGFSPEQLQSPITPFQTTKSAGTGLGLYTVENLVRSNGGKLQRSNTEAGGARVAIKLPLR